MRARTLWVLSLAVLCFAGACSDETTTEASVRVTREGFSIRNDAFGVAALVRVDDGTRTELPVTVTFSAGDERVSTQRSTLPFCPQDTDCWWGESYTASTLGEDWEEIDAVDVRVGAGRATEQTHRIIELDVVSEDDTLGMRATEPGTVYTIVFDDGEPRWGGFATVRRAPDEIGAANLIDPDERMRAFLYVDAFGDAAEPGAD